MVGTRGTHFIFVDAAHAACGTHALTGVLTPTALHIFRVGARAAKTIVDADDMEFAHVAVIDGVHPQFAVWARPRSLYGHGHAQVYTASGALVSQVAATTMLPVGMAASPHGELALLFVYGRGDARRADIVVVNAYSGEGLRREAPEALPDHGASAAGIAFVPTGVVCCDGDIFTLFQ